MKTNTMPATCECGEVIAVLDASGYSTTLCCPRCCRGVLSIHHPDFRVTIPLADFSRKRGDEPQQRPLDDLQLADSLVDSLVMEQWPSAAVVVGFGIESPEHHDALDHANRAGVRAYDFDRVMGDGPATTCLVRSVPNQPYGDISFFAAGDAAEGDSGDASYRDRSIAPNDEEFE